MSPDVLKITPQEAHERMEATPPALLVCAYDSEEKFRQNHLDGAWPLQTLRAREPSLRKNTEIIFYCA
jgi:rhodanese-related sulfurtransferase